MGLLADHRRIEAMEMSVGNAKTNGASGLVGASRIAVLANAPDVAHPRARSLALASSPPGYRFGYRFSARDEVEAVSETFQHRGHAFGAPLGFESLRAQAINGLETEPGGAAIIAQIGVWRSCATSEFLAQDLRDGLDFAP
jgi:hypothetical protein